MRYENLRKTLKAFYKEELPQRAEAHCRTVFAAMDAYDAAHPEADVWQLKSKLYETIADAVDPVLFADIPFCCETGALVAYCDGRFNRGGIHGNGWLYLRNEHLFQDPDPERWETYRKNKRSMLYTQTGGYVDIEHFGLPVEKLFRCGLSGVDRELQEALARTEDPQARNFYRCARTGIAAMMTVAGKFAAAARARGDISMAQMMERIPWQPPRTFREGLCALAFHRKVLGALEGVGFNSFGRLDVLLQPLYQQDLAAGTTEEALFDLLCRFLLIWDCSLDRETKMEKYADYELETTLTLGGCDETGKPVWNEMTRLFLRAQRELRILIPKIMIRYSAASPAEYLTEVGKALRNGQSLSLYANDDCLIPALLRAGVDPEDARNYIVGGCWDANMPECGNKASGEYLNLLLPMAWAIHQSREDMESNRLYFPPLDDAESFEDFYSRYLDSIRRLMLRKAEYTAEGARIWHQVSPACLTSALMKTCISKGRDVTAGGGKYNWECIYFSGFPDVVDGLLAIKKLCFEDKTCSLASLLEACRQNWPDESLRQKVIRIHSYGDGSEESSVLAGKLSADLYRLSRDLPTAYGGQYRMGFNQYTEIIWWGQRTPATPNGRRSGDYMSHGLTPSRLQETPSVSDVLSSLRHLDLHNYAGSSVINLLLPAGKITEAQLSMLFRAAAKAGVQGMQLNCVDREELLRAQKDPENHKHIIVRVCGFSAPFVSLSATYQAEFLSRNFHDL